MAKDHKRIMEQLKADVSEMLDNAKAVRGEAFAEAAYYSLTIAQILRIHALGTADRVDAGLISGARGETEGEAVCAAAGGWRVPTLLLYAGDDRLVAPRGSDAFAAAAAAGGASVTAVRFPALYHEVFNEPEPAGPGPAAAPTDPTASPFRALAAWLDARG